MENSKACKVLRNKLTVTDKQYKELPCYELACYAECVSYDSDTLTEEEQEKYMSVILEEVSAKDLIGQLPEIRDVVANKYMDIMFTMKAEDVKKKIGDIENAKS